MMLDSKINNVVFFTAFIFFIIAAVFFVYFLYEKRKKRDIKSKFKKFKEDYKLSKKDLRSVPRVLIPESLNVLLTMTEEKSFGLKALVIDMSLSGFAVKPDFPLKKLSLSTFIRNVVIKTPINIFSVKEIKVVRFKHQVEKRMMAFHIAHIEESQFEELKKFMVYLDKFLKKNET